MYDTITPEQWVIGLAVCLTVFAGLVWLLWHHFPMSSTGAESTSRGPIAAPVATTATEGRQLIATPGNAVNPGLPGNGVADPIPAEARDIIRMQAKAEAVVELLKSAKMTNKAEAIELIFTCSRSGRPSSIYQQAVALVDQLIDRYPARTPDQEQNRVELGLTAR